MRQFKLWNGDRTASFNFTEKNVIITDVTGLGTNYDVKLTENKVVNFQKEFEDISLLANFGVNANAYAAYNEFARFVAANGRNTLVLEYTANKRTLYADVVIKRMPKTQKTNFGVIAETLTFIRLSYWYTLETIEVPFEGVTINNTVMDPLEIKIVAKGSHTPNLELRIYSQGNIVSRVKTKEAVPTEGIVIDAETKKVYLNTKHQPNAYNLIDKKTDSFILIPEGVHMLAALSSELENKTGEVIATYKKWVID